MSRWAHCCITFPLFFSLAFDVQYSQQNGVRGKGRTDRPLQRRLATSFGAVHYPQSVARFYPSRGSSSTLWHRSGAGCGDRGYLEVAPPVLIEWYSGVGAEEATRVAGAAGIAGTATAEVRFLQTFVPLMCLFVCCVSRVPSGESNVAARTRSLPIRQWTVHLVRIPTRLHTLVLARAWKAKYSFFVCCLCFSIILCTSLAVGRLIDILTAWSFLDSLPSPPVLHQRVISKLHCNVCDSLRLLSVCTWTNTRPPLLAAVGCAQRPEELDQGRRCSRRSFGVLGISQAFS